MGKRLNNNAPIFLNIDGEVRERLQIQMERFGSSESMLIRMAVIRWLEEEEEIQRKQEEQKKNAAGLILKPKK